MANQGSGDRYDLFDEDDDDSDFLWPRTSTSAALPPPLPTPASSTQNSQNYLPLPAFTRPQGSFTNNDPFPGRRHLGLSSPSFPVGAGSASPASHLPGASHRLGGSSSRPADRSLNPSSTTFSSSRRGGSRFNFENPPNWRDPDRPYNFLPGLEDQEPVTPRSLSRIGFSHDDFLQLLLADFSSPSIPPRSPRPPLDPPSQPSRSRSSASTHRPEQPSSRRGGNRGNFNQVTVDSEDSDVRSSPSPTGDMPTTRKRTAAAAAAAASAAGEGAAGAAAGGTTATAAPVSGAPSSKRRRISGSAMPRYSPKTLKKPEPTKAIERSLFSDDDSDNDGIEVVDLVDKEEAGSSTPEPEKPKVDNSVKLSAFQCVICMDDVTNLTVTHCGHLFCSECLHSSLHIDATKKICPMCRQKIDMRPANPRAKGVKGYFPLELKLMTRNRVGKRPAQS